MPLYASFNPISDPAPVTGWYDTDQRAYPSLPSLQNLLEVTADQWAASRANPTNWAVVNGAQLIAYTAPLSPANQAQMLLAINLAKGITITSTSLSAVNATYALDNTSTAQIFQIGTFTNSFGFFPNGFMEQAYPDVNGVPHLFTVPVFVAFLRAVAALVSNLQTQAAILTNGGTANWPPQTANIT